MKRSNSANEFGGRKSSRTTRYVGRFSLPKLQSHRKKLKPRQKQAKLSDYLEDFDELDDSNDYRCHASTSTSSDGQELMSFGDSQDQSKYTSSKFERLRYDLKNFIETHTSSDSMTVNSQETKTRRIKTGSYLWLNLQAFFANRNMHCSTIQHSLELQERLLKNLRDEKCSVLDEIAEFRIAGVQNLEMSWLRACFDPDYMRLLHQSWTEIGNLLDRYDSFYCLFPCTQSMIQSSKITPDMQNRVQVLYAWYNNLTDLNEKIRQISVYFEFLNDAKRKTSLPRMSTGSSSTDSSSKLERMWPRFSSDITPDADVNMEESIVNLCDKSQAANYCASMYCTVVSRSLRLRGMISILNRLDRICLLSVEKIWSYFLKQRYSDIVSNASTNTLFTLYKPDAAGSRISSFNPLVSNMNLPSYFNLYLFFVKIPVDLLNQWLQMRAEKVNSNELDLLTLNTLIEDSHDALKMAISIKRRFIKIINSTCQNPDEQLSYLENFDIYFDIVYQNYFYYLRSWSQSVLNQIHNTSDAEWCERLISKLRKEWKLSKSWSSSVVRGESTAAKRFCDIAKDLFDGVKLFLTERFDIVDQIVLESNLPEEDYILIENEPPTTNSTLFVLCRELRQFSRNLRERSLKSLLFLRNLCSDLEICAKYRLEAEKLERVDDLFRHLINSNHVMIQPEKLNDCHFVILCQHSIVKESEYLDHLLNATFSQSATSHPTNEHSLDVKSGYVVLIPTNLISYDLRNRCAKQKVAFSLNTRLNLSHFLTPTSIFLISDSSENLIANKADFEHCISSFMPECLTLVEDFCSCNDQIFEELTQAKDAAFSVGQEMWSHATHLNEYILNGRDEEDLNPAEQDTINNTLLQAYLNAFDYYRELSKIVALPMRRQYYHELVNCLNCWAGFVVKTLRSIKKSTPTWVLAPLKYFLCLPFNSFEVYLSEEDHQRFSDIAVKCLDHLRIISQHDKCSVVKKNRYSGQRLSDRMENIKLEDYYTRKKVTVADRIFHANESVDVSRDNALREASKIGVVTETRKKYDFNFFSNRRAPFEWQRLENKIIGRGSFGTVFLVMNLRDNCLMATKQLSVPTENTAQLRAIADEVENLRNLSHPNLVKYYGVEVHGEELQELLIFMEYCSEGTLARVCREGGLDFLCVRRYTHYLLSAISYIHENNIVHRDIKPANVFLGQKDVLKLGDFGCSLRLQGTSTKIGEIVNCIVGTTAYSAPELQTSGGFDVDEDSQQSASSRIFAYRGYGRAVDIWACGATVLEMLSGKRPYWYLEHEMQIIFQLGSGIAPRIPPEIVKKDMAYSFLINCFKVNPDERPDAKSLLQHPFANVVASIETDSQDLHALGFSQQSNSQPVKRIYRR